MEEAASYFNNLKRSQRQYGRFVEKRDTKKHQVKKKANKKVEATKVQCANKLATVEAASFCSERSHNKTPVALEGQLTALKSARTNRYGVLVEEFADRLQQQQTTASARERVIFKQAKVDGKKNENQNLSDHYHDLREEKKRSVDIEIKLADALRVKYDLIAAKDFDISQAVKEAKAVERSH